MGEPLIIRELEEHVAILRLNRPQVLNALNLPLMDELVRHLKELQDDHQVRAIILTGNSKAFAAGADIGEMAELTLAEIKMKNQFLVWDHIPRFTKPLIAAVQGYALGGGCELAMSCDMVIAGEGAIFGQPEINLGLIPGAGGTQRLTKILGKARAMAFLLTGEPIPARLAYEWGLVTKVVPDELVMTEALRLAKKISSKSPIAITLIKEAVYKALDTPTQVGMDFERNAFYMCFGTEDSREGMRAFLEKRKPNFQGR